ncbi:MAG: hypothetical protein O7I93_07115 [Gemmatimonadetes bacterium]|nr:hypothetical protein [Gemmatimonadota bacterium]
MMPSNRAPTHPGEMLLEEFLKPLGMTQAEAARQMAVPLNRLNELITVVGSVLRQTPGDADTIIGYRVGMYN